MGFMNSILDVLKLKEEGYDEEDYFDEADPVDEPEKPVSKTESSTEEPRKTAFAPRNSATKSKRMMNDMEVCVIKPTTPEDAREITDTLLSNRTVVLNMEGLDVDIAQRIIDFASGSTYAINGNFQQISRYIFIITPASVDVSGDFSTILGDTFDVSSF